MHIHYQGFQPDDKFVDQWKETLSLIHEKLPYNSSLCCCMVKQEDGFWASVRIRSLQGEFAAFYEDAEIEMLAEKIKLRLLEQIDAWHEVRAEHSEDELLNFHHKWMTESELKHLKEHCQDIVCPLHDDN